MNVKKTVKKPVEPEFPWSACPERTKEKIFAGAIRCIEHWGVEKTTLNDIARAANCSRQTVYNYFKNRDAIIEALLFESGLTFMERVRECALKYEDAESSLLESMIFVVNELPKEPYLKILADPIFSPAVYQEFYSTDLSLERIGEITRVCLRNSPELLPHADEIGEVTSRIILSLMMSPGPRQRSTRELRRFLKKRILPGLLQP